MEEATFELDPEGKFKFVQEREAMGMQERGI